MQNGNLIERVHDWYVQLSTPRKISVGLGATISGIGLAAGIGYVISPEVRDYLNDVIQTAHFMLTATPQEQSFVDWIKTNAYPHPPDHSAVKYYMEEICRLQGPYAIRDLIERVGNYAVHDTLGHFLDYFRGAQHASGFPNPQPSHLKPLTQQGLIEAWRERLVHRLSGFPSWYSPGGPVPENLAVHYCK